MKNLYQKIVSDIRSHWTVYHWFLLLTVIMGTFLRFYQLEKNLIFHGELGHNYLEIKNAVSQKQIPLLGPPTSHPWLKFGPLFYWIMAPIMHFAHYNPLSGAYFFAFLGSIGIIICFEALQPYFGSRISLIASFLISLSPVWLALTRQARFYSITAYLFFPFLYLLLKAVKSKKKVPNLFWLSFVFGLMLNFHYSVLVLLPGLFLIFLLSGKKITGKSAGQIGAGLLLTNLPFLLSDLKSGFPMLRKLLIWLPYRILGFIGLYPKNTLSGEVLKLNLDSFLEFIKGSFVSGNEMLGWLVFMFFIYFIFSESSKKRSRKINAWLVLLLLFSLGVIGLFFHGAPPAHYYTVLSPLPIIMISIYLNNLLKHKIIIPFMLLFFFLVTANNFIYYFSPAWFYPPQDQIIKGHNVPYHLQLLASQMIRKDAGQAPFSLERVGPGDQFAGDYAQNYQYLLWWLGNEPVTNQKLKYTLYEDSDELPSYNKNKVVFFINNLAIVRSDKR